MTIENHKNGPQQTKLSSTVDSASNVVELRAAANTDRVHYAAVVDQDNVEIEITDFMVRRACQEAEKYQQFPFAVRGS